MLWITLQMLRCIWYNVTSEEITTSFTKQNMEKKQDTSLIVAKAKSIKDAQDRKDLSIAYFNSTNSAINMVANIVDLRTAKTEDVKDTIIFWREWFLTEHKEYRQRELETMRANIPVGDALTRLRATTNLVDLKAVWSTLTQDERNQADILAEAQTQRKKYVTPKA